MRNEAKWNAKDKKTTVVREGGGQVWEDQTLLEWDPSHFRLFCGDLGGETTDDTLTKAFSKYPSFVKARVIRDKRTQKSKGFGFVSFKDPDEFVKAAREMNGKYIGSRPVKIRKATTEIKPTTIQQRKLDYKKRAAPYEKAKKVTQEPKIKKLG
ncbi:RNA-binding domain-containing protein [Saitoella complicata NRRL Y-17804]|nr:RNA-binding domain-containing protein [Saitoella complicata NRRL Y-17804]ODQ55878.1 RNA-binding domain-containing protein [Saitoella complicata NRRL Y-17804]